MVQGLLTTLEAIKGAAQAYEGVGVDELILMPTVADLNQVDRLTDAVASSPVFRGYSKIILSIRRRAPSLTATSSRGCPSTVSNSDNVVASDKLM